MSAKSNTAKIASFHAAATVGQAMKARIGASVCSVLILVTFFAVDTRAVSQHGG